MVTETSISQSKDSTLAIFSAAVAEARALLHVEAKLTVFELREDLRALKVTAILFVLSLQVATISLGLLLVGAVLGLSSRPQVMAVIVGSLLLVVALGVFAVGYRQRPLLLQATRRRLSRDRELLKILEPSHLEAS